MAGNRGRAHAEATGQLAGRERGLRQERQHLPPGQRGQRGEHPVQRINNHVNHCGITGPGVVRMNSHSGRFSPMAKKKAAGAPLSMADRDGWIWYDGKLVPWRSATTHVLTHSLHYGLAVFEGVR